VSDLAARLTGPASTIPQEIWDRLANPDGHTLPHPFTRHAFFLAVEESGSATRATGWDPMHLLLERQDKDGGKNAIALLPLYRKTHSYGEYVFDHAWADALMRAGERYYPKLQASVPFTPVPGNRFLIARGESRAEIVPTLLESATEAIAKTHSSSLHITFMQEDEWQAAAGAGFLQRNDQQFHWENNGYDSFDAFLADLSASKRKTIRRERAAVAAEGVTLEWKTGPDLTEEVWDAFFDCYVATGSRKWNDPYLTREFFSRIGETMGEQILLVMAKHGGRYIAGALNFFDHDTLYGRNWGCVSSVPFLHFEACYYQAIDAAIAKGFKQVQAGAQGGHKLLRGYMPAPTYSAHYIAHPGLRNAVESYLEQEREAVTEHMGELRTLAPYKKK
jgi:predicted N-acyltransferase